MNVLSLELQRDAQRLIEEKVPPEHKDLFNQMLREVAETGGSKISEKYIRFPVDPETFLISPNYLNVPEPYPVSLKAYKELNSGAYTDAILTGGIGSTKTSISIWTILYQVYLLSCLQDPHKELGVLPSDEILIIFQNFKETAAKKVGYERCKSLIGQSPYFKKYFPFDPKLKSELIFENRIKIIPLGGMITAALGQNVFGGLIDEINFMEVVEKSKRVYEGEYDQAEGIYNTISTRRQTRFMSHGSMPGVLCMASSRNYPGQFTDRKEEERLRQIEKTGSSPIYLFDKTVWDVKPWEFSKKSFWVFKGDNSRKPRILKGREVEEFIEDEVVSVPEDFRPAFERKIYESLKDLAGVSTSVRHPFIIEKESVSDALGKVKNVFSSEWTDFVSCTLELLDVVENKEEPRAVHLDLSLTGDSCGFAIGYVSGFKSVVTFEGEHKKTEIFPEIIFDGLLEIRPPKNLEIIFSKVRNIIYLLRDVLGINIKWVTADGWQSVDTLQILHDKGYITGTLSVDVTTVPYQALKMGLYDRRISAPAHALCAKELRELKIVRKKGSNKQMVDHEAIGSKDVADAMAGVVQTLTTRREIYHRWNVEPGQLKEIKMKQEGPDESWYHKG